MNGHFSHVTSHMWSVNCEVWHVWLKKRTKMRQFGGPESQFNVSTYETKTPPHAPLLLTLETADTRTYQKRYMVQKRQLSSSPRFFRLLPVMFGVERISLLLILRRAFEASFLFAGTSHLPAQNQIPLKKKQVVCLFRCFAQINPRDLLFPSYVFKWKIFITV